MSRVIQLVLLLAFVRSMAGQVVVNEIMYAPDVQEPEWVELYNAGEEPVDLAGWKLRDAASGEAAIAFGSIAPRGFAVITRDTARLRSLRSVPSPMIRASLPALNNDADAVMLIDISGGMADSVPYRAAWGGVGGVSLERRWHALPGGEDSTWGSSKERSGATPGRRNSLAPAGLDLAARELSLDASRAMATFVIENPGMLPAAPALAILYHDGDENGAGDPYEEVARRSVDGPAPGGVLAVEIPWPLPPAVDGDVVLAEVRMPGDERPENNFVSVVVLAVVPESDVMIAEIMFDPLPAGSRSGAEYVELYNANAVPADVAGWKLYDATGRAQATLPDHTPAIAPGGRLVVASDTTIFDRFPYLRDSSNVVLFHLSSFGLNTDGDEVVLRNAAGTAVDSLAYTSRWHRRDLGETKGLSLERITMSGTSGDPRNWSTSAAALGGTPGARNSVELAPAVRRAELGVDPPTVSPDADGFEDFTRISYHLPTRNARIMATVYDRHGRPVRRLANNEPAAAEGELIWDGRDDDGRPLAPGIFVVRVEAYDDDGYGVFDAQGTVVVARKM